MRTLEMRLRNQYTGVRKREVLVLSESYKKYFIPQKMMRTVLIALIPLIVFGTYLYGLRVLFLLACVTAAGVLTEWLFQRHYKKKISEAVFVTSVLYTLTLPAAIPMWMAVLGIVFGLFFGKLVFGGFGTNPFNPALVARAFVYVNFPEPLTIHWTHQAAGFPGGFGTWLMPGIDAVTEATPMILFKNTGQITEVLPSLIGNIPGAVGETSAILILLCAAYLIWKKVASWEVMIGGTVSFLALNAGLFFLTDMPVMPPLQGILSGGILFAIVFMATDPISCCKTKEGKFIFGAIVGITTVLIRALSLFNGGAMFSILIANTFGPIIDVAVKRFKSMRKMKKEVAA